MTPQEMTAIRNKRILDAFNLQTPDRIPIWINGQGFFQFVDPKATLADYFKRPHYVDELLIEATKLPDLEGSDKGPACGMTAASRDRFAAMFFAKMRLPGRDLPDNALWNVDELGPMTEQDYDTIVEKGWDYMTAELNSRIGIDLAKLPPPDMEYMKQIQGKLAVLGKSTIDMTGLAPFPPFETVSGARKLNHFIRDLRRIPEKVRAALAVIEDHAVAQTV